MCKKTNLLIVFLFFIITDIFADDTIQCQQIHLSLLTKRVVHLYLDEFVNTTDIRDIILWIEQEDKNHTVLNLTHLTHKDLPIGNCGNWFLGYSFINEIPICCFGMVDEMFLDTIGNDYVIFPDYEYTLCQEEWDPQGWRITKHADNSLCWNRTSKYDINDSIDSIVLLTNQFMTGVKYDKYEDQILSKRISESIHIDSLNAKIPSHFYIHPKGILIPLAYQGIARSEYLMGELNLRISARGVVEQSEYVQYKTCKYPHKLKCIIRSLKARRYKPACIREHFVGSQLSILIYLTD